jgi:Fe-S oxidoreductase
MVFSPLEMALFVLLVAGSAIATGRGVARVFWTIRRSKPDVGFTLRPLGRRIWDFFWEIICQAKVIRERPLPGLAHAFVFWGFCAFALITLNHLALPTGERVLRHDQGIFGPFYFTLAFLFAITVAVSIVALAIRRFLVRPKWLGATVSWESGLIAALIFTLMVTYIADYLTHGRGPAARWLWWTHTLALLIFAPLIPRTKHLHLLVSPLTVFLSRGGFSQIPPLAGDEDFGLDTGKDVTKLLALQAYSCVECGRCQEHCPAANTGKLLNPKEIALGLRGYLNENGPASESPLLGVHLAEEAVFQCTTCGACEYQCPVGIEHLPLIIGLRRGAVNTGKWEDPYGTKLFLNLERNGNPLGMAASERDKFIQKNALPLYDGTQDYCLWLGCMGALDSQGREIVLSLVRLLRFLNVSFGVLRKERCCGDAARRLGNDLIFTQLAEANLEQMKAAKVNRLLSICPHCVRTMREDWKEFGAAIEIEHHSVLLARHQTRLPAGPRAKVVYHDPCYLGRYQNIYDEPREVIGASSEAIDPPRSRERSFCCGAGGGLTFLGEEKGTRVSQERAKELVATGAGTVGVACPFCNTMFRDALTAVSPAPPRLLDIAQLAAANLPPDAG